MNSLRMASLLLQFGHLKCSEPEVKAKLCTQEEWRWRPQQGARSRSQAAGPYSTSSKQMTHSVSGGLGRPSTFCLGLWAPQ